jgi:hypothetical protein
MGEDQDGESKKGEVASFLVRCSPLPGRSCMNPAFERYIGIDYSGAETPKSSLKGLRVYAADRLTAPREVVPQPSPRKYWTRRGVAEWLVERLSEGKPTLVGIDHGFSFPLQYFDCIPLKIYSHYCDEKKASAATGVRLKRWPLCLLEVPRLLSGSRSPGGDSPPRSTWEEKSSPQTGATTRGECPRI